MNNIHSDALEILAHVGKDMSQLNIAGAEELLDKLKKESTEPDFWKDNQVAQANMKEQAKLESKIKPWVKLHDDLAAIAELSESSEYEEDKELASQLKQLKLTYNE